jgi:hypothetical protein
MVNTASSVAFRQERWRGRADASLHEPVERRARFRRVLRPSRAAPAHPGRDPKDGIFVHLFVREEKPRELYSAAGTRSPWLGG